MTAIKQDTCQHEPERDDGLIRKTLQQQCVRVPRKYPLRQEMPASRREAVVRSFDPAGAG
ncbi:hypothetical protein [Rhodanobacter sp. B04]|uniref:hypothetical protein n=1 Tax=Rhodanobacter sp. B04 TaxID=1945860 RepID=UPI00111565BD|nr:hypothetical protein [Rhodanobacter sp. B04]